MKGETSRVQAFAVAFGPIDLDVPDRRCIGNVGPNPAWATPPSRFSSSSTWFGLPVHTSRVDGVYAGRVRRIQIHIDEALDDAAEAEAARRGLSKAALIRASLARELVVDQRPAADPWKALTGWLDDGPVEDLDAVVYDRDR